jgi:hypothetical protein
MSLQHDDFEHHAAAWVAVHNQLKCTGHSLLFHPKERVGLVSGHIHHWIKKFFHIFSLGKESCKFYPEFNVELHGTDDDRELMARYNARREVLGMVEYDSSVSRLREVVHEALVKRSHK